MPGIDLTKMAATRVPRGALPAGPARAATPPPKLSRVLADICALAMRGDKCLICGGASWVGPHEDGCPVEKAMVAMAKEPWLREDGLHIDTPDFVVKDPKLGLLIRTIPYLRWMHLDLDQRDDAAARQAKGKMFKAVKVVCQHCAKERYILSPRAKDQRPEECWPCFKLRSLGPAGLKAYAQGKVAEAKSYAARGHRHSAKAMADAAKLAMKILSGGA